MTETGGTFDEVLGLRPNLAHAYRDLAARLWSPGVGDPVRTERCRLRVAQLLGRPDQAARRAAPAVAGGLPEDASATAAVAAWPTDPSLDAATRASLAFAEQFVMDPTGVTGAQRAELRTALGQPSLVGLTYALALFDGFDRFRLVLGVAPDPPGVFDPGAPDPAFPDAPAPVDDGGQDPAGAFATAQPALFASFERLYAVLWSGGVVDHPSKEVARLRNARVTGCRFCRNVRFAQAREDGLDEALVDLIADGYAESRLEPRHKDVIALADVFLTDPAPGLPAELRRRLVAAYGPDGLVELVAGLALFMGFSKIAVSLGAFPEDFATTVLPTPGAAPAPR